MTERDELLASLPARVIAIERAAARLAADDYAGPRRPRAIPAGPILGGHGESVPLPSVSGGSGEPPAEIPIAVTDPEGWTPRAWVHRVVARYPAEAAAIGLGHPIESPGEPSYAGSVIHGVWESSPEDSGDDSASTPDAITMTDDVAYGLGSLAVLLWLATAALLVVLTLS